jgi:glycosyltransferase involved in cell wall biosynthesis
MGVRIVQIVETLEIGGLERMALDLAIAQKQAGNQSAIYCVFRKGALANEAEAAGVPVLEFHKPPGFSWTAIREIAARLRDNRIQVVHTHNSVIHHYGVLAGKLARVQVIVNTRHGTGVLHTGRRQELYYRAVMPFTNAFVFVCEDGRRFFLENLAVPANRSHVILNGIPLEKFQHVSPQIGSRRPVIRFGTLGRTVPAKAHDILIDAFALLHKRLPQAQLRIVGGGPLEDQLRAHVAELALEQFVSLEGPTHQVAQFLSELDVFVLSSVSEGLPLVVLEAMAAGLPIVSTRIGGIPEVAPEGEAAWLCPPGNAAALADVLYQAAVAPDLARYGHRARELALARYGLPHMQRAYETLFHHLLAE